MDSLINGNRTAIKKMWYFPLKPRLQLLFWSSKTTNRMRWHVDDRVDDGILRYHADSRAWKCFDERYPDYASDARNIRLGLNPMVLIIQNYAHFSHYLACHTFAI